MTEETEAKPKTKKELVAERKQAKFDAMIPEGTMVMCDDGVEREVIYRETAIENGGTRYFTGEKCNNGHMRERKVKGYVCITCNKERRAKRHQDRLAADPDYKKEQNAKRNEKRKERYANDPEFRQACLDKAKGRRAANKGESMQGKAEAEIVDSAE